MTSVINAAHASGARVVLTVQSFAWSSTGVARQKALLGSSANRANLARQIAAAVRDRGADGVNLDFEPIVSTYAERVHGAGPLGPRRAQQDLEGLSADLRYDRLDRQLPDRGGHRIGRRGRGRDHGLRLQGRLVEPGRVGRATRWPRLRHRRHDPRLRRSHPGIQGHPRRPVLRPRLVDQHVRPRLEEHLGHEVRRVDDRRLHAPPASTPSTTARSGTRSQAVAWTVYRRENCTATYGCVKPWRQLYYDDAKALGLKYDAVNRYNLRGAGIWALGYDGTRTELYSMLKAKFITDTVPPVISAASLSSTVPVAERRRADGHRHRPPGRHRPPPLRVGRQAVLRRDRQRGDRSGGVSSARTWPSPGMARTLPASVVPDGTVSDHRLDRRRLEQQGIDQQGRDRRPARSGSHARRVAGLDLAQRRRPLGPHDAVVEGRPRRSPGRRACSTRTARRSVAGRSPRRTAGSWVWNGRNTAGTTVADGRYTLRVRGYDRAGNQTIRDLTVRVDRTIRSVTWARSSFTPRAGQKDRSDVRPAPEGDRDGRDLPGLDPRAPDLDGSCPGRRHVRLDVERQDGGRACSSSPGPTGSWSTRRAASGRRRFARNVIVIGPRSPERPSRLASHDRPPRGADRVATIARAARRPRPGVWVVLPTYDEAENIGPISAAILGGAPDGDAARGRR